MKKLYAELMKVREEQRKSVAEVVESKGLPVEMSGEVENFLHKGGKQKKRNTRKSKKSPSKKRKTSKRRPKEGRIANSLVYYDKTYLLLATFILLNSSYFSSIPIVQRQSEYVLSHTPSILHLSALSIHHVNPINAAFFQRFPFRVPHCMYIFYVDSF